MLNLNNVQGITFGQRDKGQTIQRISIDYATARSEPQRILDWIVGYRASGAILRIFRSYSFPFFCFLFHFLFIMRLARLSFGLLGGWLSRSLGGGGALSRASPWIRLCLRVCRIMFVTEAQAAAWSVGPGQALFDPRERRQGGGVDRDRIGVAWRGPRACAGTSVQSI